MQNGMTAGKDVADKPETRKCQQTGPRKAKGGESRESGGRRWKAGNRKGGKWQLSTCSPGKDYFATGGANK